MTARILIVDDSVVIRQLLREVLAGDPQLEVAGVAANGRIALAMLEHIL
jgi:two-component system chemotaxis response regulator CheB